ncbi:MAG TPA: sulfatase-like hydrolase/transferase [Gemmataceae bacterium]|nr:sulfatase-like hydrolase/transferase [Gemmataceae bacterium]
MLFLHTGWAVRISFRQVIIKLWQPFAGAKSNPYAGEIVSLVLTVCTALFLTKAVIAYRDHDKADMPPQIFGDEFALSLGRLFVCCAEDFAVGTGCLLFAFITLKFRDSRWYRGAVRLALHIGAVLAICFMIVNVPIYHVIRRFLTVSLFELAGGLRPERSIHEYATISVKLAVAMLPLLVIALHLVVLSAFPAFWRRTATRVGRPLVLLLLIAGLTAVSQAGQYGLFPGCNKDFAKNPHLLLARSLFWDMSFGDLDEQTGDLADFEMGDPHLGCNLEKKPKNIILIVLESCAAQYFQVYGFDQPTTPGLQQLKEKTLVFENIYATSNHTIASALPLFGSTYNDPRTLSTIIDYPTFPVPYAQSWLKEQGYKTYFLGAGGKKSWEGYRNLASAFLSQGFDVGRDPNHPFWQGHDDPQRFLTDDYLDPEMFADATRILAQSKAEKFFVMMWNYSTHCPFYAWDGPDFNSKLFPPAVQHKQELSDLYRDYLWTIHQADALISNLCKELEGQGLAHDTLVVVTGDHGEAFGQHTFLSHGESLFEEEVHVPLLIINSHVAALGKRNKAIGSHIDLWPTIADICGIPVNTLWQGRSLLGDFPEKERRAYFSRRGTLGLREGSFKYLWDYDSRTEYLFDLEEDPGEHHDLSKENADRCREFRRRLRDWTNFQTETTRARLIETAR